jgi:hypothetical protein
MSGTPSTIRVVRPTRAGGASPMLWGTKHALDSDYWWIDATVLATDLADTIASATASIIAGDREMTVSTASIATDGMHVGFLLAGGTAGVPYVIRAEVSFLTTQAIMCFDLLILVSASAAVASAGGQ